MKYATSLLLLSALVTVTGTGCDKPVYTVTNSGFVTDDPQVEPLLASKDSILVGHVYVWEDSTNIYIRYSMDATENGQWFLTECHAHMALYYDRFPQAPNGALIPGHFDFNVEGLNDTMEYTFVVPFVAADIGGKAVAAHSIVVSDTLRETAWAGEEPFRGPRWGWWFWYPEEQPEGSRWTASD